MERSMTPIEPESDDEQFTRKLSQNLDKLVRLEEEVGNQVKSLGDALRRSTNEFTVYQSLQQESLRNYIQLVNRKSEIINNSDLSHLKDHVKNIEEHNRILIEIYNAIFDLAGIYKEHQKAFKNYQKTMSQLNKTEEEWHSLSANYAKTRADQFKTGEKLDKLENNLKVQKGKVIKAYEELHHQESFIAGTMDRVSTAWMNIKNAIRAFKW